VIVDYCSNIIILTNKKIPQKNSESDFQQETGFFSGRGLTQFGSGTMTPGGGLGPIFGKIEFNPALK